MIFRSLYYVNNIYAIARNIMLSKFFTTKFHVITGTNNYTRSVLI